MESSNLLFRNSNAFDIKGIFGGKIKNTSVFVAHIIAAGVKYLYY